MTDKLSKSMLDGVGIATGAVMKPLVKSQAGKAFIAMVPGEVLLASLDAVSTFLTFILYLISVDTLYLSFSKLVIHIKLTF